MGEPEKKNPICEYFDRLIHGIFMFVCLFAGGREIIFSYYFDENIRYSGFVVFFDKESAYYFWEMIGFL